jgi:WD40-like Beta Propeller Repeat
MKIPKLLFLLMSVAFFANAQPAVLDNNPTSIKWKQVNTAHFKVIYSRDSQEQAQRVANTLEHIHKPASITLGRAPRKISIILQSQSAISNAFVSAAPRRSEFYLMPPQDYNFIGTNDWLTLLAVHEYRHVVQFQNSLTGFNKLFYYAFGPATAAGFANVAAPQWFWEGDAVVTETAFTESGRGRIPAFNMIFRTNLLEGREFNYHKQYLRSYKHFIPDHYVLGYNMVGYLRDKTNDPAVWGKVVKRSWSVPFIPFRFSSSIKNVAGMHVVPLYKQMAAEYKKRWQAQLDTLNFSSFENITKRSNTAYTNYQYPQVLEDGSILVLKSGIGDIEQLVIIKDGQERVFTPGVLNDAGMLSTTNTKVVWNEYEFDPRWRVKNFSVIKAYDVVSKQHWRVTKKSRYASAALSPDGYTIATIETTDEYKTSIVLLDFFTGNVKRKFENPKNYYYSMPRFSDDGKQLVVLKTSAKGKTVCALNVDTGEESNLFAFSEENMGHPIIKNNRLYFNSPASGIDNIYCYDMATKVRYQVTTSKYGAFNPAISKDGETLYYNEQTRNGLDVVKTKIDATLWTVAQPPVRAKSFYQLLVEQEGRTNLLDSIPQQILTSRKYSKLKGIINPISWGTYVESDITSATLGITSRDILSTTSVSAGYLYNIAEQAGAWNATVSYQGFFPIIDVSASIANRSVNEGSIPIRIIERNPTPPQDTTSDVTLNRDLLLKWKEQTVSAGFRIPLITTHSKYISGLTVSNNIGYTKIDNFRNTIPELQNSFYESARTVPALVINDSVRSIYTLRNYVGNNDLIFNQFQLNAYSYLKQSTRDFLPRLGYAANLEWYKTGFGSTLEGNLLAFYTQVFLPGFFKHHSINGYWAYQKTLYTDQYETNYQFANRVPVPRGQTIFRAEQFYSMSVNYALPLCYPDIAIGPLLNIQRVRLNGFVDYGFGDSPLFNNSQSYSSVGAEVKFDINVMRFLPQLDIGFRYTIGLSPSVTTFEFLLGTINF